jgi:hypothetical protein
MNRTLILSVIFVFISTISFAQSKWESKYISFNKNGTLKYTPDENGNIIPDFSRVGYHQNRKPIPTVKTVMTLTATGLNDQEKIQAAIGELAKRPLDQNGIRGAILLKKGVYNIQGSLKIGSSGIVLRGEGEATKLIATGKGQRKTIVASGTGNLKEILNTRSKILGDYIPVGTKKLLLASTKLFKVGDHIVVFRPGTTKWITDLKMDQIEAKEGLVQWTAAAYDLAFERVIVDIKGNEIWLDNPIVMAMETQYGGGEVYKCSFDGRISEVGIESLSLESEYVGDTDEDHGWDAISFGKVENGWIKNVTSRYFGYSCVNLGSSSKQISVIDSKCLSPKSQIIGGRRYSFNNDGQLNLFVNCFASEGRHDYVTGAKVCGPNVFYNCTAVNAKADIGPHHRWAVGTLYDNIITDGEINIQDRGNWGTGHGWSGVTQILWNCTAKQAAVQSPYVSGKNYAIGLKGAQYEGRLKDRPNGIWEGQNQSGLVPKSLYLTQVSALKNRP